MEFRPPVPFSMHAERDASTIQSGQDHDRETIVVGNEPEVSGGLGSQVEPHNDNDAL